MATYWTKEMLADEVFAMPYEVLTTEQQHEIDQLYMDM